MLYLGEHLIGNVVTDLHGRKAAVVVGVNKKVKGGIIVVYWDSQKNDYEKETWNILGTMKTGGFSSEQESNKEDPLFLESRKFALAEAALITGDRDLFYEAHDETNLQKKEESGGI